MVGKGPGAVEQNKINRERTGLAGALLFCAFAERKSRFPSLGKRLYLIAALFLDFVLFRLYLLLLLEIGSVYTDPAVEELRAEIIRIFFHGHHENLLLLCIIGRRVIRSFICNYHNTRFSFRQQISF